MHLPVLTSILLLACNVLAKQHKFVTTIPAQPFAGDSHAQYISGPSFDGPKVTKINDTSFDWWYFDAVSQDAKSTLVVTFFTSTSEAFPLLGDQTILTSVYVWAGFENGTVKTIVLDATEAVVVTDGLGASGEWRGSGAGFEGACDLGIYKVKFDSKDLKGTFLLRKRVPAHYPCSAGVGSGLSAQVAPGIGWDNAIPDGDAEVDISIMGSRFKFAGIGYHDKNWSDTPFFNSVGSWYWGHARLGPYSLVWFDFLTPKSTRYVSSYLVSGESVLSASCNLDAIIVRPYGGTSAYPSTVLTGDPTGFTIKIGKTFAANITVKNLIVKNAGPIYQRWAGTIKGGFKGKTQYDGVAVFEEFKAFGLDA